MKTSILRWMTGSTAAMLLLCAANMLSAQSLVKNRIVGAIRSDHSVVVRGSLHPLVAVAQDEGQLSGSYAIHGMSLLFNRSAAQQDDLNHLLAQQHMPGSATYHQWLQPAQFAARYGVSQSDLQAAAAWLRSQGFTIDAIPPSADRIDFSGSAAQVNAAFHTEMHRYALQATQPGANSTEHWANSTELSFPQTLAGMVLGVKHLNTFHAAVSHLKSRPIRLALAPGSTHPHPEYTVQGGGPPNYLAPADIQTIYDITALYNSGISGTNQYIGIMGQTDITQYMSDISTFRSLSGLNSSNLPTQVVVPASGSVTGEAAAGAACGDLGESDLDVEWAGAVAKDANLIYVTVGGQTCTNGQSGGSYGVLDSLQYAIQTDLVNNSQNVIPVLSISYGNCEQQYTSTQIQSIVQLEQQANAQGQTIVASSGDNGSADCDGVVGNQTEYAATLGLAVDFPASSPYTTAAGGTSFVADLNSPAQYWNEVGNYTTSAGSTNGSALSYIPEGAWNDTPTYANAQSNQGLGAGGGGISEIFNASPNYSVAASSPSTPVLPASLSYLAAKPSWQTGPGVPNDGARDVPDISLATDPDHDGYVICTEETSSSGAITSPSFNGKYPYVDTSGSGSVYGGTSVAAPQLAAMIALWNQSAGYTITSTNGGGVGNANFILYSLAQTAPSAFHDVVSSGNPATNSNAVDCQAGTPSCVNPSGGYGVMAGYNVGAGYDQATGLGSVDVAAMASVWGSTSAAGESYGPPSTGTGPGNPSPDYQIVANPAPVSLAVGGTSNTAINASSLDGFAGTVTLTCAVNPATGVSGISCYFGHAGTTTATVTLSANSSASSALTIAATSSATASLRHPGSTYPGGKTPQSQQPWQRFAGGGVAFAALFLMGIPSQRKRFLTRLGKRAQWMTMAILLLVAGAGVMTGCSSSTVTKTTGPTGTVAPPNPGPNLNISNFVTITATSGSTTHSIEVVYNLN